MKNFVKDLITNRFGIVLATLNVCYFTSKNFGWAKTSGFVSFIFEHTHGENCFFSGFPTLFPANAHMSELMMLINLPAVLLTFLLSKIMLTVYTGICFSTQLKIEIFFFIVFILLQWLFISWAAKKIAPKLRRNT